MSIANYFTFSRILIAPLFLIVYLEHNALGIADILLPYFLLALLAVSELSDALDGYLARRYNQVTDLGKVLDPMADSIARISMFLTFTLEPVKLPMLLVFILLYRDSVVSTIRTLCALRGFTLAARTSGKIKAVVQGFAACVILLLMIPHSHGYLSTEVLHNAGTMIASLAAAYTVYTGFDYICANWMYISRFLWTEESKET